MTECWKPIAGYESEYIISDQATIWSLERIVPRGSGTLRVGGKALKPYPNVKSRYMQVKLSLNGVKRLHHVHTLVLEAFVGPRPDGMEACHGKGGRQDNRLTNLRWDTSTENSFDYVRAGDHHYAKRDSCLYGHPLPPSTIGTARKCRKCYIDGMAESSDKRTMVRILRKYGLA